ncbi:MAG: tRNA (adenosine(37)-N6)-threonylcarbamoyltransferase complex ATPase subunit type 1 TsaE [Desulfovibrionaceae bacterium]|nr:tRNA (adenosine(37)-N6)-threonylcarbamoyltransferase complex ATPase subunit type 1 TsaE [Desulfovibrionaceae bacterium]
MLNDLTLQLLSLEATTNLGKVLSLLIAQGKLPHIFMTGPLGSGKTTLTRAIVDPLPNSQACEVSSPSFSITNYYPVIPPIQHVDLYRCQRDIPEEILDNLENPQIVTLLEWCEYLPKAWWPTEVLKIDFNFTLGFRKITLEAQGPNTKDSLDYLKAHYNL